MTTAYSRIDRFLRQNLNDKDYPAYKDELDAICQAKLQRTWVGLTDEEIWKFWWSRPEVPEGEDDSMEAEFVAAVRAVLAAHGIKENT